MWCSLAGELDEGGVCGSVERDGVGDCGAVSLASWTKAVAVDPLTEMASVGVVDPSTETASVVVVQSRWRV